MIWQVPPDLPHFRDTFGWGIKKFYAKSPEPKPKPVAQPQEHIVLLKSDGLPTYHLANVVDDHYMDITAVVRGAV